MQKLPIGLQDFRELRTRNFLYVDKTRLIHQLTLHGKYFFLSRPRRFGKSLLVSTITELFKGSQTLFKDLWIEKEWDWNQTFPIIDIKLNEASYQYIGLENDLKRRLKDVAKSYGVQLQEENYILCFRELILVLSERFGQVVVLIDEYDKPIIDYLDDIPKAEENRNILKGLYSVLKPLDFHLKMVFITGVSKFSRTSIFSELNNLLDLTTHPSFGSLTGYTQEELEDSFQEFIEAYAQQFGGRKALLAEIKTWYNGYTWDGNTKLYNPFSILSFFGAGRFKNYWFETGTPTFLIKLLRKEQVYDLEGTKVSEGILASYEIDDISPETLLFQTGYLTIKSETRLREYILGYPNQEVKESMLQYILADYTKNRRLTSISPAFRMAEALLDHELENLPTQINALIGGIPYELHQDNEAYYHTVMHLTFSLIGVHIQSEIHVAKGRLDSIIQTEEAIYIFEFKVNDSAENAISQIKSRSYVQPYLGQNKAVFGIGVSFNTELKEVDSWVVD